MPEVYFLQLAELPMPLKLAFFQAMTMSSFRMESLVGIVCNCETVCSHLSNENVTLAQAKIYYYCWVTNIWVVQEQTY